VTFQTARPQEIGNEAFTDIPDAVENNRLPLGFEVSWRGSKAHKYVRVSLSYIGSH
jgi:hypothetical protein